MRRRPSDPARPAGNSALAPRGRANGKTGNGSADPGLPKTAIPENGAGAELTTSRITAPPPGATPPAGLISLPRWRERHTSGAPLAIIPRSLDEVYRVARAVLDARLAPLSYTHERGVALGDEAVIARLVVGIIKGSELGLAPITALSTIAIINQRPCIYGDGASALIQLRGHLDSMTVEEIGTIPGPATETRKFADDYGVRVTLWRKDQRDPYIGQFTVGDAKRARLWMDPHREPWIKYPRRQLKWRAFSWPARDGFADDLMGLSIAEEMLDVPSEAPPKTDTSFLDDEHQPAAPA